MLGRGVIIGGLLLGTAMAGAQVTRVPRHMGLSLRDVVTLAPDAGNDIRMSVGPPPGCPWDCALPQDNEVGIVDFLAMLAEWGVVGTPCDFDGDGVGIVDFLALLGHWGQCPAPVNDECAGKIIIDRFDSGGTLSEPFDMFAATPSPEASECTGIDPNLFQDIWYCLRNSTADEKIVTLTSTVDLLAEVTAGCTCPPGPLVTCGRLAAVVPMSFTMQPGDEVCIRLLNDSDLPVDQLNGNLVITNELPPPSEKCFNQPPNQVNGLFSDLDCDICAAAGNPPQQVLAEQLVLVAPAMIDVLRFWGGYFPGDAGDGDPLPDSFTVKFRLNDNSGGIDVPGEVVRKLQIGPATTRTETGLMLFGVREFEYTIDLEPNQDLLPGFYWVEIYNDTTSDPTDDDWFWETGTLDDVNGLPGSVFSFDPPNVLPKGWSVDPINELSLNVTCKVPPPHGIQPCSANCPPTEDPVWCVYEIIDVNVPVQCAVAGISVGEQICVTPCPFPDDFAVCDPEGTGIVTFQVGGSNCRFDAIPIDGCVPCPSPDIGRWERIN